MGFDLKKRAFFVEVLGEERVKAMEEELFGLSKELEERGVGFKDVIDRIEEGLMAEIEKGTRPKAKTSVEGRIGTLESHLAGISATLRQLRVELDKGTPPARHFINDLLVNKWPAESRAAKALRETGQPGAAYAADVLDGRVVRG